MVEMKPFTSDSDLNLHNQDSNPAKTQDLMKLPGGASGRGPTCQARDTRDAGFIPESRRSPGEGHGKPLQYSRLENPMDRSLADYSTWGYKNRT